MDIYISRKSLDYTKAWWICTYEDEEKMHNGNLHFPKKFGLYQRAVDLYLWRWIKVARWKFTFPEEVWIIPTGVWFVSMRMNKRCTRGIYISRRSLDYTNARWICTYEDEYEMHDENLHFPKKFWLYQRSVDLYLWIWRKEEKWKFRFPEEVWFIPTRCGFVPMKMKKNGKILIYFSPRILDYTNARWICAYEDK